MKKLLLSILIVGTSATLANAQKSEVNEAKKAWDIYGITAGKQTFDKSMASLNAGLKHTDNAIANEKSAVMPEAWGYRALFASAIAYTDSVDATNALAKQKIAEEALEKLKTLDAKNSEKENVELAKVNIRNAISNRGVKAYNTKDYKTALASFNQLIALNPQDTAMYMNAGVVAKMDGNFPEAVKHFKKMTEFNGPDAKNYHIELVNISLTNLKDTTAALAAVKDALAKYPDDPDFVGYETDIYINRGDITKSQEALKKLLAKDDKKAIYHYLMGDTYYKQALALQAERSKLTTKQTKEFDAISAKMLTFIDQSLPHYKKSVELDPKFVSGLETLKQIYGFKNDTANYEAIKKQLDAIPASN